MKEEYENILERQHIVEEKVDQLEQQLELSREALEMILVHLGHMNGVLTDLLKHKDAPPGWEPMVRGKPKPTPKTIKELQ